MRSTPFSDKSLISPTVVARYEAAVAAPVAGRPKWMQEALREIVRDLIASLSVSFRSRRHVLGRIGGGFDA